MDENDIELDPKEAALSAALILQPDFKFSKVTHAQLDKFKELHNRRLQIKAKSKHKGMPKGKSIHDVKACTVLIEDGSSSKVAANTTEASTPVKRKVDEVAATSVSGIKKKLHWGLEAKRRWERKANM